MLTLRAAKAPGYYERVEFARDDYYSERGGAPGEWVGKGSDALKLKGSPDAGALGVLLDGRNPKDGAALNEKQRGRRVENAAFDLTFAAPKSLSVLLAVGDDRVRTAIRDAQEAGVRDALDYLERESCFVRRGKNGVQVHRAEGFAAAIYTHEMSRSADPHLHTHLVVANRVKGPDGRWTAPDMRPVFASGNAAAQIAEARTRAELTRTLGLAFERGASGAFEVAGIPRQVLDHFSARHHEILEEARARGWDSPGGLAVLQRETRDHKPRIRRDRAQAEWRARAAEHGLGRAEIARLLGRSREIEPGERDAAIAQLGEELAGRNGLTARASTYTKRAVLEALGRAHPEGAIGAHLDQLAERFIAERAVPVREANGSRAATFTSPVLLSAEARLIERATDGSAVSPEVPTEMVTAELATHPQLGEDQAAAARELASARGPVTVLEARAGTGKTTTLRAVAECYRAAGVPVIGTSWQGQAAQLLEREAGIESHTTARILDRLQRGAGEPIPYGALVIVDEAGMMATHPMEELLEHVTARGGRVLLAGDRHQLAPLDAGGAFGAIADAIGASTLAENRRQRTDLQRQVSESLGAGHARDAIALLAEHNRLRSFGDAREARAELVYAWVAERGPMGPSEHLVLAHDRRDVRALNALCRREMEREGQLGADRIVAYGREWAAGDRLVCRQNDYRDGLDVRNGTRGTVIAVDQSASTLALRTDDGRRVDLPAKYLEHVRYGYALTGHISQGETCERTYLLATPDRGGREWAYVAGSRHRIDMQVFLTHHEPKRAREALVSAWERSDAKELALTQVAPERRLEAVGLARADVAGSRPEALRERVDRLRRQLRELAVPVPEARGHDRRRERLEARIAGLEAEIARAAQQFEVAAARAGKTRSWRFSERSETTAEIDSARSVLARLERACEQDRATLAALPDPSSSILHLRASRLRGELTRVAASLRERTIASEIARPSQVVERELGRRPSDVARRERWDHACANVAVCRDLARADRSDPKLLGSPPRGAATQAWLRARERAEAALASLQRDLGRERPQSEGVARREPR